MDEALKEALVKSLDDAIEDMSMAYVSDHNDAIAIKALESWRTALKRGSSIRDIYDSW